MTPASRSLITSLLTTSFLVRLSHLCGCTIGLTFCSRRILCIQIAGLIPLISSIVQHKADLNLLKTLKSLSSCKVVRVLLMITGFLSPSSRKAYLREEGSCLSSSFSSERGSSSLTRSSLQIFLVAREEIGR